MIAHCHSSPKSSPPPILMWHSRMQMRLLWLEQCRRKQGMERKDLLAANVKIFKVQGEALDKFAKKGVKVLVVGNPANTNAIIMQYYAPSIPKENFSAMTRLDQNRARAQIAAKAGVGVEKVDKCIIWGNHSSTLSRRLSCRGRRKATPRGRQ